jgi:lipoate synthase
MFGMFCIDFRAVMKWSKMPQNMSFGSNGVDQVRQLRKILKQLRLANLCVEGTCSANFASTFMP